MVLYLLKNKSYINEENIINSLNKFLKSKKKLYASSLKYFEIIISPILSLEKNDKIGIISKNDISVSNNILFDKNKLDFALYLDKYSIFQPILRRYWQQDRTIIFSKLDILFNEYNNILLDLKKNYEKKQEYFNNVYIKYLELNNNLSIKLQLLKATYNDPTVDSYINKYLDYFVNFYI